MPANAGAATGDDRKSTHKIPSRNLASETLVEFFQW